MSDNESFLFTMASHCFTALSLSYRERQLHEHVTRFMEQVAMVQRQKLDGPKKKPSLSLEEEDYERMGVAHTDSKWRITRICPTYPRMLVIPKSVSDSVLRHAARFRSRGRLPILSYLHSSAALLRSSQALVGLQRNRSIQDEHLLAAITELAPHKELLIVDARPSKSAMANAVTGAGFMPLEHYGDCRRVYLGIENIHAVREAYLAVFEGLLEGFPMRTAKLEGGWTKFYERIMEGVKIIVEHLKLGLAVLVHCSDGWDRTAQQVSLAQICLDPATRTIDGFIALIQREWISAGHQFAARLGHILPLNALHPPTAARSISRVFSNFTRTGSDEVIKQPQDEYCPVFPQFLDCVLQFLRVYPTAFDFDHRLVELIWKEAYTLQTDTFRFNCEQERLVIETPVCFWSFVKERRDELANPGYQSTGELAITKDVMFYL